MEFLFPHQEPRKIQKTLMQQIYSCIENKQNLIAHAPTGIGKCVSGSTLIITEKGIEKIEDIYKKTVKTNTLDQKTKKIVQKKGIIIKKKRDFLYRLKTRTGREIEATKDHKFLVISNGLKWKKLEDIDQGEYIACARKIINGNKIPQRTKLKEIYKIKGKFREKIKVGTEPSLAKLFSTIKKRENVGNRKLAEIIGRDRNIIKNAIKNNSIFLTYLEKIAKYFGVDIKNLDLKRIGYSSSKIITIPKIDEDFSYFFGALMGDGCISGKRKSVMISNMDKNIINRFKKIATSFGSNIHRKHGSKYDYEFENKSLVVLLYLLGYPQENKYKTLHVPDYFFNNRKLLATLIKGLYDTDGSVYQSIVEITTKSKPLKDSLVLSLLCFEIIPIVKEKIINKQKYFRIYFQNRNNISNFKDNINFNIKSKRERLTKLASLKSNPNIDIIPNISSLIRDCRKAMSIPYSRKRPSRIYESYIYKFRKPSRKGLTKLLKYFKKLSKKRPPQLESLESLAKSDIFWDKVTKIKKLKKSFVYDATIPSTHNFIGNGVILHNTASYLAPALTYALKNDKTLFFLTPRHSQHNIVIETAKKIQKKFNTTFKVVDFIGKKHMCLQSGVDTLLNSEFHEYCRELRKKDNCEFYLNMKSKAVRNLCLSEIKEPLHVEELVQHCQKHNLCPYEIAALLGKKAKVIIADYYHILSPTIRQSLFNRLQLDLSNCIIYFDESHNLPDRCRDLLTTSLSSITIDYALRENKSFKFDFENELLNIQNNLSALAKNIPIEKQELLVKKPEFIVNQDIIEDLKLAADEVRDKQKRSSLGSVANFLESWLGPDKSFIRIITNGFTRIGRPFINLSYRCLDPSLLISQLTAHSLIFMSGTLSPTEMYLDLLGLDKNKTVTTEFSNPFPKQNRLNLIVPTVTTKFTKRDEAMYKKISKICSEITNIVPGNTAVFFPSYDLLNKINLFFANESEKTIFIEQPGLTKLERQEIIDKFKSYSNKGAVLLGAASGSFGEGIDLPGDFLKCVIIVGLPLAKPNIETQELINYYDSLYSKGWDYAYIYPAIITSLQNAGRCIRSETDKGCIIFLDERYSWHNYKKCFPQDANFETTKLPSSRIKEFFENNN